MAIETELKLRIAPEQLARLRRHALFRLHQVAPPRTRRLYNIYFDTPKLELHQREMALRLRRSGGKWIQTLKGGGQVMAGLHQRNEWEVPVPSARLDFANLDTVVWDEYLPKALREELHAVFVTDFYRTSRLLEWRGAQIEVCMDHGEVKAAQRSAPICEVELELKSGCPQQLFELAQAILDVVPFELETVSKAEQGFRLLADYIEQPVKGAMPKFASTDSLTVVLQTLIWSCLAHFQHNLRGVMGSGTDPEYLHQMRVALRRLRVVLRMAEKVRADEQLATLRREVAEWSAVLGRIREWDVFIAGLLQRTGNEGFPALPECSGRLRADRCAALHAKVQARELQRLLLRFSVWMSGTYWLQAEQDEPGIADFAELHLRKLSRRFSAAQLHLSALDAPHLHALRILAKKLRYSAEFFASWYDQRKIRPYLAALSEVQELLGRINDIAVAHRLLDELASCPELSAHQATIALIADEIDADISFKNKYLYKVIKIFGKQADFWEI